MPGNPDLRMLGISDVPKYRADSLRTSVTAVWDSVIVSQAGKCVQSDFLRKTWQDRRRDERGAWREGTHLHVSYPPGLVVYYIAFEGNEAALDQEKYTAWATGWRGYFEKDDGSCLASATNMLFDDVTFHRYADGRGEVVILPLRHLYTEMDKDILLP